MEKIVSGEMCSRIIICWRKMSGEICLGELFVGEKCESLVLRGHSQITFTAMGGGGS